MNIGNFVEFLERSGRKTIKSDSGYWYDAGGAVYVSIPHHELRSPSDEEIQELIRKHRILGVKYSTEPGSRGKPGGVYILSKNPYDLQSLPRKTRADVRKGLKDCLVEEIDFDDLRKHGMPLNLDTLQRQDRDDTLFSQPDQWEKFCEAGEQVEGAGAWASFVDGRLAAYLVTFVIDKCCWILHSMCRTELMSFRPNHALQYTVIKEMISRPEIDCVSGGNVSIFDLQGLRTFKGKMGYQIMPASFVVVLHPLLEAVLLNRPGHWLLNGVNRLTGYDKLKRVVAILEMAERS